MTATARPITGSPSLTLSYEGTIADTNTEAFCLHGEQPVDRGV